MEVLSERKINGYDVLITENHDGMINLDIKHGCGELVKGWTGLENSYSAERLAKHYTYCLTVPVYKDKPHCDSEYCAEAFDLIYEVEL